MSIARPVGARNAAGRFDSSTGSSCFGCRAEQQPIHAFSGDPPGAADLETPEFAPEERSSDNLLGGFEPLCSLGDAQGWSIIFVHVFYAPTDRSACGEGGTT